MPARGRGGCCAHRLNFGDLAQSREQVGDVASARIGGAERLAESLGDGPDAFRLRPERANQGFAFATQGFGPAIGATLPFGRDTGLLLGLGQGHARLLLALEKKRTGLL